MTNNNSPEDTGLSEDALLNKLAVAFEARQNQGLFPYQGKWLNREQLQKTFIITKQKSMQILLELGLLFALIYSISLFLLLLVLTLAY